MKKDFNRRKAIQIAAGAVAAVALPSFSQASNYPSKNVRWIVPFPAGGPADYLARLICQKLSEKWGRSVIVDNKSGGLTTIGLLDAARASPDGYTLVQPIDASLTINPFIFQKIPYDVEKHFTHIMRLAELPLMLLANKELATDTFEGMIKKAKNNPGSLSFGYPTLSGQIAGAQMAEALEIELIAVPYKGTADVVKGLMSGEIHMAFDSIMPYVGYINKNQIYPLAATGKTRSPAAPTVRSFSELGLPQVQIMVWHGLSAPKGLPFEISQKLQSDIGEILKLEEVKEKLLDLGLETIQSNPEEYKATIFSDQKRLEPTIRQLNIRIN